MIYSDIFLIILSTISHTMSYKLTISKTLQKHFFPLIEYIPIIHGAKINKKLEKNLPKYSKY